MAQITDFIPQYQEVNVIFSRFLESEKFGFEEQKNITHFYNRYKDVKLFEKMIFDIIFSKDSRREKMLLSSIKFEIDRNITIYETGRRYFDEIEMENVNDDAAVKYLEEIEAQVRVTNQCGAEFLKVAALWENCFNLHGIDHESWEKYDSLLEKHHTEIERLNELYRKHKAVMEEAKEYEENMFRPIYELSKIFLSIIQKYMHVEGEQPQSNIKQMQVEHQKQIQEVKQSYEAEHRKQSFSADGAVCSLKEDKEGRFDLRIDGVSHHSWFRRKKDEFMEALGLPTSRRQNRGLKL